MAIDLDKVHIIRKALSFFSWYLSVRLIQRIGAIYHTLTYKATPSPKNVVVIGGSFAGVELVQRLVETLPTGYRVVLVEQRSHLNYLFAFPRFAVVPGHERKGFIPYDGMFTKAPEGIFKLVRDTALRLTDTHVVLASGESIPYAYLAVATGSTQPLPVNVSSLERDPGCRELQFVQESVKLAGSIAVVGAGATGVQLATDIKSFFPEKEVTLIQSGDRVMDRFGPRLSGYVMDVLQNELKVRVLLNERPNIPPKDGVLAKMTTLTFSGGRQEKFDLVLTSTGQRPNASILATLLPAAISKATGRICVLPTMQVTSYQASETSPGNSAAAPLAPHIFAFGDVAEHGGPMMGRAGAMQAEVALQNILAMIKAGNKKKNLATLKLRTYTPDWEVEGFLHLTLGRTHHLVYAMDTKKGTDLLMGIHNGTDDLDVGKFWKRYGADVKEVEGPAEGGEQ